MSVPDYTSVLLDLMKRRDELDALIQGLKAHAPKPAPKRPPSTPGGLHDFAGMERREAALTLLREIGQPMSPKDIVAQLLARGFQTTATKPEESMRSALRKSDLFRNMGPRGFWGLVEWGLTPAGDATYRKHALELIGPHEQLHTYTMICHGAGTCSCHCHHEDPSKIVPDCGCWDEATPAGVSSTGEI